MSKIICEVCGTSFPETSVQCPICGFVHSAEGQLLDEIAEQETRSTEYSYVKGGRFSKTNVRKRNKGLEVATTTVPRKKEILQEPQLPAQEAPREELAEMPEIQPEPEQEIQEKSKKNSSQSAGNKGLLATIIVLLLAIIAVTAYIFVRFLLPALSEPKNPSENVNPDEVIEQQDTSCQEILLDTLQIQFQEAGQQQTLHVNLLPSDTTDSVSFLSKDESVATVDSKGLVTAIGRGQTTIVVICGGVQTECQVVCDIIPPEALSFRLNRQQITFDTQGAGWLVYSGEIPVEDIIWTSDDPGVASVEAGRVTAVGEGYTVIYGEYLGNVQQCEVICIFDTQDDEGQSGNVGEEGGQPDDQPAGGQYHLDNLYSAFDTDVTLQVGEFFPLRLVDENGNQVDAQWSVENANVCKVNESGDVTALASGETYVIATYNGQQYRCRVAVN